MSTLAFIKKKLPSEVADREVLTVVSKLQAVISPVAIYSFGSAARDQMTDQSDIDLLIIMASESDIKTARSAVSKIRPLSTFPVDLVWMSADLFRAKSKIGGLAQIVIEEGKLVFGEWS